jgi:phosphatidylglycerophosphate synthase
MTKGSPPVTVWIDARSPRARRLVFGMTLLERQLRTLLEAGITPAEVRVEQAEGDALEGMLPAELRERLTLRFTKGDGTLEERILAAGAATDGGATLAWDGDAVVDTRLLAHLASTPGSWAAFGGEAAGRCVVVRVEGRPAAAASGALDLEGVAERWLQAGVVRELKLADVPDWVVKLRRRLPVYCFRVPDAPARDRAEHFLFWSNYKGSTDFMTKYVYPPLVWRLVRPLARWRVHPNWVTGLDVVLAMGAIPLFAAGHWVTGLVFGYTMSVLDSVDGKLARLTYRSSRLGDVLDHGLDIVHPPLWYLAWAWALGGGRPHTPVFQMALWLLALYTADRLVTLGFKRATGRSIHAFAPIDVRARTFISRRNVNLPVFTVGLLVGAPVAAFAAILVWQAVTLVFHAVRLLQVWIPRQAADTPGASTG